MAGPLYAKSMAAALPAAWLDDAIESAMRDAYSAYDALTRCRPSPRTSNCAERRGASFRSFELTTPSASTA